MSPRKLSILAVDDDIRMLRLLQMIMESEGYQVLTAASGGAALDILFGEARVDLVMLDIALPDMDGCDVCRRIREISQVPIIMVTARDNDSEKVAGFNAGADDYVTKPFSAEELVARTKAVLRRSGQADEDANRPAVKIGDLEVDFNRRRVKLKGREIPLTATEYRVLFFLAGNVDRILTTDQILEHVWGESYAGETNILQANIMRLRRKLGDDPRNPRYIITKMGIGYTMARP